MPGEEGEWSASKHRKRALAAIADLKRVNEFNLDTHAARQFPRESAAAAD